ncbi:MAG: hypothetical protein KDB10_11090 [Acidimicrobiales bacterium]|nr:hypothetical protein [Acidimicrobiales bacterium]MCB9373578.1 hypothetical protein [Microthrixaceae bacterium]
MPGFSGGDTSPLPDVPLPPAAPPGTADPDAAAPPPVDVDHLFTPDTVSAAARPGSASADEAWGHVSAKPLRVRDLLEDPPEPAVAPPSMNTPGEPDFFAPVTPEQLGEDPQPPTS